MLSWFNRIMLLFFVGLILQCPYSFGVGGENPGVEPLTMSISGTFYLRYGTSTEYTPVYSPSTPSSGGKYVRWHCPGLYTSKGVTEAFTLPIIGSGYTSASLSCELHSGDEILCSDTKSVKFVYLNLIVDSDYDGIITSADESLEMTAGGIVPLNEDDDDNNGTPDWLDTGSVSGEDDLIPIRITPLGPQGKGTLTLSALSGGDRIIIWTDQSRTEEIDITGGGFTWDVEDEQVIIPDTLYAEGISASTEARDVELRLRNTNGSVDIDDNITLTVIKVELESVQVSHAGPDLDNSKRMCINAQDEYKKVKYRAVVKPSGATAKVYSTNPSSGAELTIQGITSGFDPDAVNDGDEFWAVAGSSVGHYYIILLHNLTPLSNPEPWCYDEVTDYVFKFELDKQFDSADTIEGGTTDGAQFNGESWIRTDAYGSPEWCLYATSTQEHAVSKKGTCTINHDVKVITNPTEKHSGYTKVKFSSQADVKFDALMLEDGIADGSGANINVSLNILNGFLSISGSFGDSGSGSEGGALGNGSIIITNPNDGQQIQADLLDASFTSEDIDLFYSGTPPSERASSQSQSYTQQSVPIIYEVGSTICEVDVYFGVVAEVDDNSTWDYQYGQPTETRPAEYYKRVNISDVLDVSYELEDLTFAPLGDFEIVEQPTE